MRNFNSSTPVALSTCTYRSHHTNLFQSGVLMQRWKQQAREYRQKQLLDLNKPKHNGRLFVPEIARGITTEDMGDPRVCELP